MYENKDIRVDSLKSYRVPWKGVTWLDVWENLTQIMLKAQ